MTDSNPQSSSAGKSVVEFKLCFLTLCFFYSPLDQIKKKKLEDYSDANKDRNTFRWGVDRRKEKNISHSHIRVLGVGIFSFSAFS